MSRQTSATRSQPRAGGGGGDGADLQRAASSALRELQSTCSPEAYTFLKLSEPITSSTNNANSNNDANNNNNNNNAPRTSDVSTTSLDSALVTPSSLEADLQHYRELFAKLRFSYVEQVTKEKFIRAIVGDPPLIVTAPEIAELEAANAEAKAALKGKKVEVQGMVEELEQRGKTIVGRYEKVRKDCGVLEALPGEVGELEKAVEGLRERHRAKMERLGLLEDGGGDEDGGGGGKGEMNLSLGKTRELVEERRRQLETLSGQVPRKRKELERMRAEVAALENRRAHSAAAAREAKRRKEGAQSGGEDELEARGRWYRASEAVLREVLDLKG
jgi:archaellum component FlaC